MMSEWLFYTAKWAIFQLYSSENKLQSMSWWWCPLCTRPTHLVRSAVDRNFCLMCAYICYYMFYFLYLGVYFFFFFRFHSSVCNSKIEKKENNRPTKENRTWNSEYMHTGDRSFCLDLLVVWGSNHTPNSFTGLEILNKYWSFKFNFNKTKIILTFINMKEVYYTYWIEYPNWHHRYVLFLGEIVIFYTLLFIAWHQY